MVNKEQQEVAHQLNRLFNDRRNVTKWKESPNSGKFMARNAFGENVTIEDIDISDYDKKIALLEEKANKLGIDIETIKFDVEKATLCFGLPPVTRDKDIS